MPNYNTALAHVTRAPIVATWAARFSLCCCRWFSQFLINPTTLSACQSLFIIFPPCSHKEEGEGQRDTESTRAVLSRSAAATWLSLRWGVTPDCRCVVPPWAAVITHWMCSSITYEIRTCQWFLRDWPINRSPTNDACRTATQQSHTSLVDTANDWQ